MTIKDLKNESVIQLENSTTRITVKNGGYGCILFITPMMDNVDYLESSLYKYLNPDTDYSFYKEKGIVDPYDLFVEEEAAVHYYAGIRRKNGPEKTFKSLVRLTSIGEIARGNEVRFEISEKEKTVREKINSINSLRVSKTATRDATDSKKITVYRNFYTRKIGHEDIGSHIYAFLVCKLNQDAKVFPVQGLNNYFTYRSDTKYEKFFDMFVRKEAM